MRKHYHVLTGDHGYMPDSNEVFTSRRAAVSYAAGEARSLRDEGHRVSGSDGYYEVSAGKDGYAPGLEYIEVSDSCYDDCDIDSD